MSKKDKAKKAARPQLSFCVPVYNIEQYLDECLESLTRQTLHDIEIICVDDGSTDSSPAVLARWAAKDSRVKVASKKNGGEGSARNAAIAQATGDYIAFVDGDDYVDTDMAEVTLAAARASDADIVVYGGSAFPEVQWISETFGPRDAVVEGDGCQMIFQERGCIPSACNKIYRRSLIAEHDLHFDETLVLGPDMAFQFKIFPYAHTVAFVSRRMYHYRYNRAGSAINENYAKLLEQQKQHADLLGAIAADWQKRGLLEGRSTDLLGVLTFLFNDFEDMRPEDQVQFARHFKQMFDTYFSPDDFGADWPKEVLWRYQLFLDLAALAPSEGAATPAQGEDAAAPAQGEGAAALAPGEGGGVDERQRDKLLRAYRRNLAVLGMYRKVRYPEPKEDRSHGAEGASSNDGSATARPEGRAGNGHGYPARPKNSLDSSASCGRLTSPDEVSNCSSQFDEDSAQTASASSSPDRAGAKPEVTVIIPAYNVQDYIERAVKCALKQQGVKTRVIVVDDGSTDKTGRIAALLASAHKRVKVVSHKHNRGRLEARRTGIMAAKTEFTLFLDADDELLPDMACTLLQAQRDTYDIVQCSFEMRYENYVSPEERRADQEFCAAPAAVAHGNRITDLVFGDRRTTWSLCGKLMRTDLLKQAMSYIPKACMNQAEDCCIFFILSCLAESYRGIGDYRGYIYNIDLGGSDARWKTMDLQQFGRTCGFVNAMDVMQNFLRETGRADVKALQRDYRTVRYEHALTVADKLLRNVQPALRPQAYDLFASTWPQMQAVGALADAGWDAPADCWQSIAGANALMCPPHKVRTVGVYHASMGTGGAERVAAELVNIWRAQGYRVVFFSDCPRGECAYDLPVQVEWVQLPDWRGIQRNGYGKRADAIAAAVERYEVDALVYQQWWNPLLAWDMLAFKTLGVPFCLLMHGVHTTLFYEGHAHEYDLSRTLRYADALVVLTQADVRFWQQFNPRVFLTDNPSTTAALEAPDGAGAPSAISAPSGSTSAHKASAHNASAHSTDKNGSGNNGLAPLKGKNIVWVGRLTGYDKQPREAIRIMQRVAAFEPQATLTLVGPAETEFDLKELKELVQKLGLQNNVQFAGEVRDVMPYYREASVYLLTSRFESWCLSLAEAMEAGLPTVMYELPYLTLVQDNDGIIAVPQGDCEQAARAIVQLLGDKKLRRKMGRAAHERLQEIGTFDFAALWKKIFKELGEGSVKREGFEEADAQWDMLLIGLKEGLARGSEPAFFPFMKQKGRNLARRIRKKINL